jgi:hypothetical protein
MVNACAGRFKAWISLCTQPLKQVPACEYNPMEAIKTNILGSSNVIDAALWMPV